MCGQKVFLVGCEVSRRLVLQHCEDLDHLPRGGDVHSRLRLIRIPKHSKGHVRLRDQRLDEVSERSSGILRLVRQRATAVTARWRSLRAHAPLFLSWLRRALFRRCRLGVGVRYGWMRRFDLLAELLANLSLRGED